MALNIRVYDKVKYNSDSIAKGFAKYIEQYFNERENYICYYEEPDYLVNGNVLPTFTILDKKMGIIVIKLYEYTSEMLSFISNDYWEFNGSREVNKLKYFEDYCYTFKNDVFMPSNEIYSKVNFTKIACFPLINKDTINVGLSTDTKIYFDDYRTIEIFNNISTTEISDCDWEKINSIIQKANILNKDSGIPIEEPAKNLSEAIIINNQRINKFDDVQLEASWSVSEKPERIRGLAGTGKTVILAIKAAKLHRKYPDKKIAYVFNTQALYNQVNSLINRYYHKITGMYPNPDKLMVMHAWGGRTSGRGFYYNTCNHNGLVPLTFYQVKTYPSPFGEACKRLLDKEFIEEYDYILIDEAQDLPVEFFKLAAKVAKKPAKIIIAYDELQTTNDTIMPDFEILCGKDKEGKPLVSLEKENDFILKKSYRNNIKVLMTAFAFGFGFYSKEGVSQIIKKVDTWEALGFKIDGTQLKYNEECTILRSSENNPNNIQKYFKGISVLNFNTYDKKENELYTVTSKVIDLVKNHNVNPHDIMVIDMECSKDCLQFIQNILVEKGVNSIIPGIIEDASEFLKEGCVTLTTPRRAKGNEVPIVFVVGSNVIYRASTLIQKRIIRNMLFVAITRSKGWVFISGSGDGVEKLYEEYTLIQKDISDEIPFFKFTFPSEEVCNKLADIDYILKDQRKEKDLQDKIQMLKEIIKGDDADLLNLLMNDDLKEEILKFANGIQRGDS